MLKSILRLLGGASQNQAALSSVSKEGFSNCVRSVLLIATQEATRLQQRIVRPEHLLIAILREQRCTAYTILSELSMDAAVVESRIAALPQPPTPQLTSLELSREAKKTLEIAVDEGRRFGNSNIGTEHLLLALLRQKNTLAAQLLKEALVSYEAVRNRVQTVSPESQSEET